MNEEAEPANEPVVATVCPATAEEKAQWARRFLQSGLSLRKFSLQNGLSYMALWRWSNKARAKAVGVRDSVEPAFAEIKGLASMGGEWAAELTLPNGTVLRFSKEVPPAMVDQLLRIC